MQIRTSRASLCGTIGAQARTLITVARNTHLMTCHILSNPSREASFLLSHEKELDSQRDCSLTIKENCTFSS